MLYFTVYHFGLSPWNVMSFYKLQYLPVCVRTIICTFLFFPRNEFFSPPRLVTSFSSEMKFFLLLKTFVVLLSPFLGFFGDDLEAKISDRILRQNSIKFYYLHLQLHFVMHLLKLPPWYLFSIDKYTIANRS
jgi:hypothetical protein